MEFSLQALHDTLQDAGQTEQVTEQATEQVNRLLSVFEIGEKLTAAELQRRVGLKHRPTFLGKYLRPALLAKKITMTQPASPRSPTQRYFLADAAKPPV